MDKSKHNQSWVWVYPYVILAVIKVWALNQSWVWVYPYVILVVIKVFANIWRLETRAT